MTLQQIFDELMRYAMENHSHPDPVARMYAGIQDLNRMFFDWGVDERKKQKGGDENG